MIKVLVFGTFDGLHNGHKDLFRQALNVEKGKQAHLIVVIARDSTVIKNKGKQPKFNEKERLNEIKLSGLVQEVLLGEENHDTKNSQYDLIAKINPDIICLGYDQSQFKEKLVQELTRMNLEKIEIKILKPYKLEVYKSSLINKMNN